LRQLVIEIDVEVEVNASCSDGRKQRRRENWPAMPGGGTPNTLNVDTAIVRQATPEIWREALDEREDVVR
jgi:hypothetical protein